MTARRHRRIALHDDSGATLVLALIVVTVVALVVGALLGLGDTSLRATVQLRAQASSAATADGAAQAAINALRRGTFDNDPDSSTYPNCFGTSGTAGTDEFGATLLLPNLVPGGSAAPANSAAVRCQPDPSTGPADGPGSFTAANKPRNAILTLSQNPAEDGLRVKALSPTIPFNVRGGVVSDSTIAIPNGSLRSNASVSAHTGCTGTIDSSPAPVCAAGTTPDPGYAPETTTLPARQPVPQNSSANCPGKVVSFQPGYYDDAAALSDLMSGKGSGACKGSVWWFEPGVYYFDFQNSGSHQWLVRDGALIAGTPTDSSGNPVSRPASPAAVPGACVSPLHSTTARGVQFIFGGDSRLQLAGSADVEICGTYHADRPPIAIFGLPSDTATPANASAPGLRGETTHAVPGNCLASPYTGGSGGHCAVLSTQTSYKGHLAVQGTTYTPIAPIDLTLSNLTEQALHFGVIARTLWIKETGALRYSGPVIEIPDDAPGPGADGTVVYLTVYVCAGSPTCKTPSSTLPDPPVGPPAGRESLRVRVYIHDPTGTPVAGSREMTVQAWAPRR